MTSDAHHTILVRLTVVEDWMILKNIRLRSLLDSPSAFATTYTTAQQYTKLEWCNRASSKNQHQYALAMYDKVPIGMIGWTKNTLLEFEIIAMWVDPMFRGKGVADQLMVFMKKLAKYNGYHQAVLNVSKSNMIAKQFYLRHGFILMTETEDLPIEIDNETQKMVCTLLF
ncbi:GNAT family N-acetyltransferase [Acinetobacter boissieri]|uniref:Acetyltransferase (GNAT) domain-containing protein n=1 Tax=Acinetobacter boissieri TaxID=1219383 RepID=A0A1G6GUN8_9GAMM|nr:GNAT family N-acetyltransferase [Acinetobacter boissieri]SDB85727.1 Acetyltransferase (GNAT) domain-containing protein [Acinetobacter boissieri]